jgi:hypothetical protein
VVFELVEVRRPKLAIGRQPVVELYEWLGPNAIQAALRLRARLDQPRVFEDAEVLRDSWLTEADAVDEFADGSFPLAEQVEDLKPPRLGQDLECSESHHRRKYF